MLETATPLDAALRYAELGWPVVPLHTPIAGVCDCPKRSACEKPGKHPRTLHGLDDASVELDKICRWWKMWPHANVGIHLQRAGLIDVAPDSLVWQAQFVAYGLPWTSNFRSGGGEGHEHHLYRRPEDCPPYRLCVPDEYDLLSNGYAVMPPSVHASGARYTWMNDPDNWLPSDAPKWAVDMLVDASRRTTTTVNGHVDFDGSDTDEAPVQLTGEALERWNGQVVVLKASGAVDRSRSLFYIGLNLAKAGASRGAIARALKERDEALGWSKYLGRRDALTRYTVIADRALSGRAPRLIAPTAGAVVPDDNPSDEPYQFVVHDAADFLRLDLPKIEWLVEGLIREQGIVGNFGGPGSLKTYFATQLGITVSLGPPHVFLEFSVKRAKVLIVQEDTPESDYQQIYLRPMVKAMNVDPNDLRGWLFIATSNDMLLDEQDRLSALDAWLGKHQPGLLILDAFFLLHQGEGMTAKDLGPVLRALKQLRKKHHCAIWIIDHNRKQSGKGDDADPIDKWYGGRPKSAATDGAIEAHVIHGHDDVVEYKVVKMRGGQKLLPPFQMQIKNGTLHPFTTEDSLSEATTKVYDWLIAQSVSRTVKEIEAGVQLRERAIRDAIRSLSERGWIEPGDMVGTKPHQQKTWLAVRVAGLNPEQDLG